MQGQKRSMRPLSVAGVLMASAVGLALAGCAALEPARTEAISTYALEAQFEGNSPTASGSQTLVVGMPRAAPGFDSARMVYVRKPHQLEFFAKNQWVDTPARMLAPLLVQALERGGKFRAVAQPAGSLAAELRLDTEIIRLQQEFANPRSRVHLTVRAVVIDLVRRRVVATREFDIVEPAPSEDPDGGVVAANRAVKRLLAQMAEFCGDLAAGAERKAP